MLYKGSESIADIYVGDAKINRMYAGDELICQQKTDILPYIVEYTVSDNTSVRLNIDAFAGKITIDWGDGTVEETSETQPAHTYTTGGVYHVSVKGRNLVLSTMYISESECYYITGVISWGNSIAGMESGFDGCEKLSYIPADTLGAFRDVTTFIYCFISCYSLVNIPEGLFDHCVAATGFESCFSNCISLHSIPEKLFANCPDVLSFHSCFSNCTSLTGSTPKDDSGYELWERAGKEGYPSSVSGSYCFWDCTGLDNYQDIPLHWKGEQ